MPSFVVFVMREAPIVDEMVAPQQGRRKITDDHEKSRSVAPPILRQAGQPTKRYLTSGACRKILPRVERFARVDRISNRRVPQEARGGLEPLGTEVGEERDGVRR
jgi:hypothetical protein